jgi:hypothetical protein
MVSGLHGFCNVRESCVEGGVGRVLSVAGGGVVVLGGPVGFAGELVSVAGGVIASVVPLATGPVLGRTLGVRTIFSSAIRAADRVSFVVTTEGEAAAAAAARVSRFGVFLRTQLLSAARGNESLTIFEGGASRISTSRVGCASVTEVL